MEDEWTNKTKFSGTLVQILRLLLSQESFHCGKLLVIQFDILHQSRYCKKWGIMAEDTWFALCQAKNISYEVLDEIRTKNYLTLKQRTHFMFFSSFFWKNHSGTNFKTDVLQPIFFFIYLFFLNLDLWEANFCCLFFWCLLMCISAFCKINGCFQYTKAFAFRNKKCGLQNSVRKTFICVLSNIQSKFFPLIPKM